MSIQRNRSKSNRASAYLTGLDEIWRRVKTAEPSSFLRRGSNAYFGNSSGKTNDTNGNGTLDEVSTVVSVSSAKETESLYDRLYREIFVKDMSDKKYIDIIRIAHIVKVERSRPQKKTEILDPCAEATEADYPDRLERQMYRMMVLIKYLVNYFGRNETTPSQKESESSSAKASTTTSQSIIDFMFSFHHRYLDGEIEKKHFNLVTLFNELHDQFTTKEALFILLKTKKVLKFLHISVVVYAIEEIRDKLKLGLDHLTKDIRDSRGWQVTIRLDDKYVEIRHNRREAVLRQQGENNYWEIEYNITSSFDSDLSTLNAVRLAVTDLQLSDNMDETMKTELNTKFFSGRIIVS